MEQSRRPILGYVGGIAVANTAYSGNLAEMTIQQLKDRLWDLRHSPNPDSDEGFEAKMVETEAIQAELKKKGYEEPWWEKPGVSKEVKPVQDWASHSSVSERIICRISDSVVGILDFFEFKVSAFFKKLNKGGGNGIQE